MREEHSYESKKGERENPRVEFDILSDLHKYRFNRIFKETCSMTIKQFDNFIAARS